MMKQIVMSHAQWFAAGGWEPQTPTTPDDIVIAILDVNDQVQSASWGPSGQDPAERLNGSIPAEDVRT